MTFRALVFLLLLTLSRGAWATEFCFSTPGDFDDSGRSLVNGTTEDYWVTTANQPLRGANFTIRSGSSSGQYIAGGYLGDGTSSTPAGCTAQFTIPVGVSSLWVQVKSVGYVRDNLLRARDDDQTSKPFNIVTTTYPLPIPSSFSITVVETNDKRRAIWKAYVASSFALYRTSGGLSGKTFTLDVYNPTGKYLDSSGAAKTSFFDGTVVKLKEPFGTDNKFLIVHELGHHLADLAGIGVSADCSFVSSSCPVSSGTHSLSSKEYQGCAASEGFAHFYSARVWNSTNQDDCVFSYYKDERGLGSEIAFDCEGSGSTPLLSGLDPFPTAYFDNVCTGVTSNMGVEADWLRALWDTHTNGAITTAPTFINMIDWMRNAFFFTPPGESPYANLDYEANIVGGSLNSNWDLSAPQNGIVHP